MARNRVLGALLAAFLTGVAHAAAEDLLYVSFDDGAQGASRGRPAQVMTTGDLQWTPGRTGKALLARTGATCAYPTPGILFQDSGTLDLWVRPDWDAADGRRHFILADDARAVRIFKHTDGDLYFQADIFEPKRTVLVARGPAHWQAGEWHHVQVAWEGFASAQTAAVVAVYVDGVCLAWSSAAGKPRNPGVVFWLGSECRCFRRYWFCLLRLFCSGEN